MKQNEQKITIEGKALENMRNDANMAIQRLLRNMAQKNSFDGKLTIGIDIKLIQEFVPIPPEQRTETSGETRSVLKPVFDHKISSTVQIKDDAKGKFFSEMLEMVYDETTGEYVLVPVTGEEQMNIYDVLPENADAPEEKKEVKQLTGPTEDDAIDAEYEEVEVNEAVEENEEDIGDYEYQEREDEDDEDEPDEEDEDE